MIAKSSHVKDFYKKNWQERLAFVKSFAHLSDEEVELLKLVRTVDGYVYDPTIENVVSGIVIPLGIATNFIINGKDYLIPMATEEPSVVAGACNAAKLARPNGGFSVCADDPIMIGQLLIVGIDDFKKAEKAFSSLTDSFLAIANAQDPFLVTIGGGARELSIRELQSPRGLFLVIHLLVNVKDAMGANIVNSMLEALAPVIVDAIGGTARAKIVSNLATSRMVTATATWKHELLGKELIEALLDVYTFACVDPHRAVTHNKGIMNGVDAVALATGNDFRAVEAGAHGFAATVCYESSYQPLTHYELNEHGDLVGTLRMPLAVGVVGGTTKSNSIASLCLKILGVQTAAELAGIMAAVGLAQNFAALKALASEGIQKGHMRLHSRNVAINAGIPHNLVDDIARRMVDEDKISFDRAKELLIIVGRSPLNPPNNSLATSATQDKL